MNSYNKEYTPRISSGGLHHPSFERAACGVGLAANVDGVKSHGVIERGIEVLNNLRHRGAAGADPETGDGAGLTMQMPHEFIVERFAKLGVRTPGRGDYGIGMTFLPRDADERARCEAAVERAVADEGQRFLGWRDVPISPDKIGELAERIMPVIRQFMVGRADDTDAGRAFDLRLLVIRKLAEKAILGDDLATASEFYICSLSARTLVYKGLVMAYQLADFYHDLNDEGYGVGVRAGSLAASPPTRWARGDWRIRTGSSSTTAR